MKFSYLIPVLCCASACTVQQPQPAIVDAEKFPLDTEAANISYLRMEGAAEHFNSRYKKMKHHKAFAQSNAGAWGFYGGMPDTEQAMHEALNDCRKNNAKHEKINPCRIVNLDGFWGPQLLSGLPGSKQYTASKQASNDSSIKVDYTFLTPIVAFI